MMFKDESLTAIWAALQKNDTNTLNAELKKAGLDGPNAVQCSTTMQTLVKQASDYDTFAGMVRGEIQTRVKLGVQEVGALAPAGANWTGSGGRSWEGSSSVVAAPDKTAKSPRNG